MTEIKGKYVPNYQRPEEESDVVNISGRSPRENVPIEEAAQRAIAESETWLVARAHNRFDAEKDTRKALEELGFTVLDERDDLFYEVRPPEGWSKSTQGYWTTVLDTEGKERMTQFFKGAWYDTDAFLNIVEESSKK